MPQVARILLVGYSDTEQPVVFNGLGLCKVAVDVAYENQLHDLTEPIRTFKPDLILVNHGQEDLSVSICTAYQSAPSIPVLCLTADAASRQTAWLCAMLQSIANVPKNQQTVQELSLQSAALMAAGNAIVITNRRGVIQWVNPAWTTLTGFSADESLGKNPNILRSGHHDKQFYRDLWKTIIAGDCWESEMINRRKDGSEYFEHNTINPVRDARGVITHFIAIKEDITQRKRMEDTVREGERRLLVTLKAANMGTFDWDIVSGALVWSPTHYEIFGYSSDQPFTLQFEHFSDRLHPDDRNAVIESLVEQIRDGKRYAHEFRIQLPDGVIRWIDARGEFKCDSDGKPIQMVGTAQDITERKLAEQRLKTQARLTEFQSVISNSMSHSGSLEQSLNQCATAIDQYLQTALVQLWTVDETAQLMTVHATAGKYPSVKTAQSTYSEMSHLSRIVQTRQSLVVDRFEENHRLDDFCFEYDPSATPQQISGYVGVPMIIEDRCVGVISILTCRTLGADEFQSLEAIADVIGQNIDRIHKRNQLDALNRELERRIEDRTARLAESERFNRATLDALNSHVVVLDSEGVIVTANRAWKEFAHLNQCRWQSVSEGASYLMECDRAAFEGNRDAKLTGDALRKILSGEIERWTHEYPCHSPQVRRWFLCSITCFRLHGRIHALVAHENITAMKLTEEALRDATREAEQASRAKSEFLAAMSHELRTPLNGVLGMNTLLQNTPLSNQQRELVENSSESGKLLLQLINDILDISKIEAGKMELDQRPCELKKFIRGVVTAMAGPARAKGLQISCNLTADFGSVVVCDDQRLRQILVNLIGNATKFTSQGAITIDGFRVRSASNMPRFRISVTDTGKGIPESRIDRLFQMFSQVDSSTTRQFGGSGLGLSICKRLIELMGGTIGVESRVGVGSTFWFEFPATIVDPQENIELKHQNLIGLQILAVNQRQSQWDRITQWLEAWGCLFDRVDTIEEAATQIIDIEHSDSKQMVLIVDQRAIGIDSFDRLSQIACLQHVRVFIVSTTIDPVLRNHWLRSGIAVVLDQPVVASDLFDALIDNKSRNLGSKKYEIAQSGESGLRETLTGHVLVAEDNRVNQLFITELLKLFGCTFDLATNGEEAVSAVLANHYSLVLMDCRMPEMDGFSATKEIRKWEHTQPSKYRIPIVALTANALTGDRQACLDAGMDDYVTKPIEPEMLRMVLVKYLST